MRRQIRAFVTAAILMGFPLMAGAEIPQAISYQGKVTDVGGAPVPNGDYSMAFTIYDQPSGGSSLWSSGVLTVTISGGVFSVLLGDSGQPMLTLLFDTDYWLEVDIAGDVQTPRVRLGSVGYAYMASGLVPGTSVIGAVLDGSVPAAAILGGNTGSGFLPCGLWGASISGAGVYGTAESSTGWNYGVLGRTYSASGDGVHGTASATTGAAYGGYFESSSSGGIGVFARATAGSGDTYGLYAVSASPRGIGVYGETTGASSSDTTYGGWFRNSTLAGAGVAGKTTGGLSVGVLGESYGAGGAGVYALSTDQTNFGAGLVARTWSSGGTGVHSWATATTGTTWGGHFRTSSPSAGAGAYGWASATNGITHGVWGESWSTTPGAFGIYYTGGIGGTGAMTSVTMTSRGPTGLGVQATAGDWVEDFGEAQLVNGHARVELDPVFLETVTIDDSHPMKVFVELGGECLGVYVVKGTTGFEVVELQHGRSSARFDYRVLASRRGFEDNRLKICEAARHDSYLYPKLRAERMRQLQEERRLIITEQARAGQQGDAGRIAPRK